MVVFPFFCYDLSLNMLGVILGVSSLGLLALLLIRAVKGRFVTRYPLFYVFISGWLVVALLRFFYFTVYSVYSEEYNAVYWSTQFLLVAGGYGVLWQIYTHTLKPFPGTSNLAKVLVTTVFLTVLIQLFVTKLTDQAEELTKAVVRLDQNLHSVQAVLMILFVMLVWYYGIPLGKNLRGLVMGYGFLVGTRLFTLALRFLLGEPSYSWVYSWWYYSEPICVFATLVIWSVALRTYQPNPIPEREIELEEDYQLLAHRTVQALSTARGYLMRAFLQ